MRIKTYFVSNNREEAERILNEQHPEKILLCLKNGDYLITTVEDLKESFEEGES